MNHEQKLDYAKKALLTLKEKALSGTIDHKNVGICFNLSEILKHHKSGLSFSGYDVVCDNSDDWEQFSGDEGYPIKGGRYGGMWEGEQLTLRISLIDHLIAKCNDGTLVLDY